MVVQLKCMSFVPIKRKIKHKSHKWFATQIACDSCVLATQTVCVVFISSIELINLRLAFGIGARFRT